MILHGNHRGIYKDVKDYLPNFGVEDKNFKSHHQFQHHHHQNHQHLQPQDPMKSVDHQEFASKKENQYPEKAEDYLKLEDPQDLQDSINEDVDS